jgi:site-specific DNA-methyltransferase (cytosine-N4-specific)
MQRDYGVEGQLGMEETPEEFVANLVEVLAEVRRALRRDGTLWVNLGDSYAGARGGSQGKNGQMADRAASLNGSRERSVRRLAPGLKPKDLVGIPWMVAFALRADGWFLRAENIWHKLTPMPESVQDRTTRSHEQVFLLSRSSRYFYDADAVRTPLAAKTLTTFGSWRQQNGGGELVKADNWSRDVPDRKPRLGEDGEPAGANLRSVWSFAARPYPAAHFATFPPDLVEPCILAGAPGGATVLDPFAGAATTGVVATRLERDFIGIELNSDYVELGRNRIRDDAPLLNTPSEVTA